MNKLNFEIEINAPVEKVWDKMLGVESYKIWTLDFNPGGSSFEGTWEEGSKMLFLGPDPETGKMGGMVSTIKENRKHEFVSIEHIGQINDDGTEDTTSEKVLGWQGSYENYTFTPTETGTKVSVELAVPDEFKKYMEDLWPKALEKLKDMCEK